MTIYRDPEYERMQKEEWFNLTLGEMRFSLYERLADVDQPVQVPEDVVKQSIRFHSQCRQLTITANPIFNWFLKDIGITDPIEIALMKRSGALKLSSDNKLDLRNGIPKIALTINIDMIKESAIRTLGTVTYSHFKLQNPSLKPLNVLIEALAKNPKEIKTIRKSKSGISKKLWLAQAIDLIITENRWDIKDIDLMIKFVHWVDDYINHESVYALSMITRLKAMTHSGNPIYSVEGA